MKRTLLGCGLAAVALAALAGSAPAGDGRGPSVLAFGLAEARAFDRFPLFWAGEQVDGLPLVAVLRRDDSADFVSFVYGDCEPASEAGCPAPVELQVWPACRRHLGLHATDAPLAPSSEPITVRGVPGLVLDGGRTLELQTGRITVVVFADSPARASLVTRALRPVEGVRADVSLPPPAAGAIEGRLRC